MSDFFEFNLSDHAETLRINAAREVINVAEYEHDPSTLSDFSVSKTRKFNVFVMFGGLYPFSGTPLAASGRLPPISKHQIFSS